MTDKKDATPSDPGKRPHATLDLKATEVKGSAMTAPTTPATASDEKSSSSSDTKIGTGKASSIQSDDTRIANGDAPPTDKSGSPATGAPSAQKSGSRVFAHLLSGVAGGLLALFGADQIAPMLGFKTPGVAMNETSLDLQKRLSAIEAATKAAMARDQSPAQIAALGQRVDALDQLEAQVKQLETTQTALATEAKAAAAESAKLAKDANAGERIEKLENRLATLAAAAGTDGDKGRIQGLAAVTGKISDLETGFNTKLAELHKGLIIELEPKLAAAAETSEKARTGTERLDREVAGLKTDAARFSQGIEVQKSESERLAALVQVTQQESAKQTAAINGVKSAVETQLSAVARPADVASAVSPVTQKLSLLESNLAAVMKGEDERKVSAERIVVTLELGNLKRALERGQSYATELAAVRQAAKGQVDLAVLDRYKDTGVKTLPELQRDLNPIITAAIDADTAVMEGSVMDRLLAGAKLAVRVRKLDHAESDKSAEAVMSRIEKAIRAGELGEVLAQAKDLPPRAVGPVSDWLSNVEARHSVDTAIGSVESGLKTSLTGKNATATDTTEPVAKF